MGVYSCKKCGALNYLTPHAFWNLTEFGAKCPKCETIHFHYSFLIQESDQTKIDKNSSYGDK